MPSKAPFSVDTQQQRTMNEFEEIVTRLRVCVSRDVPEDLYQYCADYFSALLREQRHHFLLTSVEKNQVRGGGRHPHAVSACREEMEDSGSEEEVYLSGHESPVDYTPSSSQKMLGSDEESEGAEANEEGDQIGEMDDRRFMQANQWRGRRTSVSAESMAPMTNGHFEKIVIPKTAEQRSRIEASIANNFLFKNLDEEQYQDVINAMSEKQVKAGERVIEQGAVGDYFYVVETGQFEVYIQRSTQELPAKVAEYGPCGSFGELALMYNAPRAATVIASAGSVLWALDRVTFRRILMESTSHKRRMYENFLEEVPFLASLHPYERQKIADALDTLVFEDGEYVIRQGDCGDNFYIIESGSAKVLQMDDDGVVHFLPGLKKGDYFGELALLNDRPRAASIVADGRLKVVTLGKKAFIRLLGPVVDIIKRNTVNYVVIGKRRVTQ